MTLMSAERNFRARRVYGHFCPRFAARKRKELRMSYLSNLRVGRKFAYAFGLVCLLCVGLALYTFLTLRQISAETDDVNTNSLPSIVDLSKVEGAMNTVRRADLDLLLFAATGQTAKFITMRESALKDYDAAVKDYMPTISYPAERELYDKFAAAFADYLKESERGKDLLAASKNGEAMDAIASDKTVALFGKAHDLCDQDLQLNVKGGVDSANGAAANSRRATWVNSLVSATIVALCALIGIVLNRIIAPRLVVATGALQLLAEKDLTASVDVTGQDEIGQLGQALNTSVDTMRELIRSVAHGAETLSAATTQISTRAVQSSGNANTQSSKTNQIAAAAQEM